MPAVELLAAAEPEIAKQSFLAVVQSWFNAACARAAAFQRNPVAGVYARRALTVGDHGTPTVARHPS